jgi:hypothetical protein
MATRPESIGPAIFMAPENYETRKLLDWKIMRLEDYETGRLGDWKTRRLGALNR